MKALSVELDIVVLCDFQKRSTYHVRTTFTPRAEMSCIVLLRSFLLSYNRVVRSEVFTVLLDAPAEANMHLCLFQCVSHYLPRCTKAFLSHQHSGRVFKTIRIIDSQTI